MSGGVPRTLTRDLLSLSQARLIYDGDEVVLRSTRHKWVSPALIVRSVDQKGAFAADTVGRIMGASSCSAWHHLFLFPPKRIDLVTQMQKVAFEYRDYPNHFMNVDPKSSSVTVFNAATSSVHQSLPSTTKDQEALSAKRQRCDSGHVRATQSLVESAIWTILGVDCRQYHWFDPRAKLTTLAKGSNVAPAPERPALMRRMPVTPVPRLFHAQVEGHEMTLDISLHLLQLLDQLSDVELVTTFDQLDHYLAYDVFVGGLPCTTLRVLHNLDAIRGCLLDDKGDATKAASAMTDVPGECKAQIVCRLPKVNDCMQTAKPTSLLPNGSSTLAAILSALPDGTNVIELPILLVRRADGIVYRMHSNVQYLVVT